MQVDSGLSRWPIADVFLIPASNPPRGVDGFIISMNWQFRMHVKSFYTFFNKLFALKRAVLFFTERDNLQQAFLLLCSPSSWCLRLFDGNFHLGWLFPCSLKSTPVV
jgi:hypothetical protein